MVKKIKVLKVKIGEKEPTLTRIIKKRYDNDKKCGGCNWPVMVLYSFPKNPIDEEGLCGDCMMDLIVDDKRWVETVPNEEEA